MLLPLLPGCVTRKLFLRSDPPGAQVILDGELVGETPYEETFLSYGVRRVELRLDGHERLVQLIDVARPWWQYLPFALITDVLWPFEILDEHHFDLSLAVRGAIPASWDDARAAYERMQAHKARVTAAPEGAGVSEADAGPSAEAEPGPEVEPSVGAGDEPGADTPR